MFGVLTLSTTMSDAFTGLFSKAYGAADLTVTAAGGSGAFDEAALGEVRGTPDVESAAPRLALPASLVTEGEGGQPDVQRMRVFGVEPQTAALATGFDLAAGRYPENGAEVTLDKTTAEAAGLKLGDDVRVATAQGPVELDLVGTLVVAGGSFGGYAFGMVPLPYAQKTFDQPGEISGIAVDSADGTSADTLEASLAGKLGDGFQVERSSTRTEQIDAQFQGFKIALLFFAGTALFVGAFLVFNALSMTILERTRELGMLRALGSTRGMIARSVILEAGALGIFGSILGVGLGYLMARGLVYLFGIAFQFQVTSLALSPFALVSAIVVGIIITVLAALYPAFRAGRVSPVEAMRSRAGGTSGTPSARARLLSRLSPVVGLVLVGIGAPWIYYLARNLSANLEGIVYASGIAGVIGTFLGVSLIIPALVRPLAALFSPILRLLFGVEGRMAASNASRSRGRTALTASALMVGIALVVSFSALGGSVLGSIRAYLEDSLGSDYVIQPENQDFDVTFSPELASQVSDIPGVEGTTSIASTIRRDGDQVSFVFGVDQKLPGHLPTQPRA